MSGHTKGPWEIERYSDGLLQIVGDLKVIDDDEENVTTVVEAISYGSEANAKLIAAAPELLEALEIAYSMAGLFNRDSDDVWVSAKNKIEAAIAKARGEV